MCNNITIVHIITFILCFIYAVETENYDDHTPDYDESVSVSESNEAYVSLKQKPVRMLDGEIQNTLVNGNNAVDISVSKDSKHNLKFNNSQKCKQAVSNYPYSVSIQRKGTHYASGALIHKKWILTVAGEFYNIRESIKFFRARLGAVNCKKGGSLVPLKGIEIHPSYVYNEPIYDLAMLRIGLQIDCSNYIKPITLSTVKDLIVSAKFLATYWPRLIINGKMLPQSAKERMRQYSMRVSTQKIIPWDKCYNIMDTYNITLDVSSLCLEPIMLHHSPCMPDVGAPIIAHDGLWGITSVWVSEDCSTYTSPTVFTRISVEPTKSWIADLMEQ